MSEILLHSRACIATAEQMLPLFKANPLTTEKIAAHAFFCRCVDHFRAVVLLAQEDLDPEALVLVRGIVETTFVIGGLLTGSVTTEEMEAFDLAGRAKGAKAQDDFLRRNASSDLRERVRDFAERNAGPTLKFEQIAKRIDADDLYNGHYRMFSHVAAHPSMSSISKYLEYGEDSTSVRYPGSSSFARVGVRKRNQPARYTSKCVVIQSRPFARVARVVVSRSGEPLISNDSTACYGPLQTK